MSCFLSLLGLSEVRLDFLDKELLVDLMDLSASALDSSEEVASIIRAFEIDSTKSEVSEIIA